MTKYLISFDEGWMTFPEEEFPDVSKAALEVSGSDERSSGRSTRRATSTSTASG